MSKFIAFTKTQTRLLNEVISRHQREADSVLMEICTELGIDEAFKKSPQSYRLRQGFDGFDVTEPPAQPKPTVPGRKGRKGKADPGPDVLDAADGGES